MKAVASKKPWQRDPVAAKRKWDEEEYQLSEHGGGKGQLCFGLMWDDGTLTPHPPVLRALEIAKASIEAAGHKGNLFHCKLFFLSTDCAG